LNKLKIILYKMLYLRSATLLLLILCCTESAKIFKENASDYIDVGFNKGRTGTRLAEIAVKFRPRKMFEDEEDVNIENIILEVKSGDDCWTKVDETPAKRGKEKFMWRVKVVPCKQHLIRIGVITEEGCVEYYEYPAPVGPATHEEIANSHFRPSTPEDIVVSRVSDDSVVVSWTPSPCAESYELWYESDKGDNSGNITVSAGFGSVTVRELLHCTDYMVYVTALVGEEFSESGEAEFSTCNTTDTDIHEEVTIKLSDEKSEMCKREYDECEVIKPEVTEDNVDIAHHTNKTIPEIKSEPEAQTQANSGSSLTLSFVLLVVLWTSL